MEKKCVHCQNSSLCIMYVHMSEIAQTLNRNMDRDISGKSGFTKDGYLLMVDTMAYNCNKFAPYED